MRQAPGYFHARYYKNKTPGGKGSATAVKQGLFYYSYGTKEVNPDQRKRGEWYGRQGLSSHGEVVNWAVENALESQYTYTMVLSVRDGEMVPQDFMDVVQANCEECFNDWRLIVHYDTGHVHAHVVAFRDKTLKRKEFHRWSKEMRESLEEAERHRLLVQQQESEQEQTRQPSGQERYLATDIDLDLDFDW